MIDELEHVLDVAWEKVRSKFFYPALPYPRLAEVDNGLLDFRNLQITLGPGYIQDFSNHGISLEDAMEGVLAHEVTHYMRFPGSIANTLRLTKVALDLVDEQKAKEFVNYFDELRTNIYTANVYGHNETPRMRKATLPSLNPYDNLMNGVYQLRWGYDMGLEFSDEEHRLIRAVNELDLLSTEREREREVFRDYVKILKSYDPTKPPEQEEENEENGNEGKGNGSGAEGNNGGSSEGLLDKLVELIKNLLGIGKTQPYDENDPSADNPGCSGGKGNDSEVDDSESNGSGDNKNLEQKLEPAQTSPTPGTDMFNENQIKEGKSIFAGECNTPGEYERVIQVVFGKGDEESEGLEGKGEVKLQVNAAGLERKLPFLTRNIYTALAKRFSIPIKEKVKEMGYGQFPSEQAEFSIGDPLSSLNPYATPGIYPGLSVKRVFKGQRTFSGKTETPDCLLLMDNSESMVNPDKYVSLAVLTGTVIADGYLSNGSKVGVYNFGSSDLILPFTTDKGDVHRTLRFYANGGTWFNETAVTRLLEDREFVDIAVLSDMEIHNFRNFVSHLLSLPQTHRIHLLSPEENNYTKRLREQFDDNDNVVVRVLESQDDINKVTMGDLSDSFEMTRNYQ